MAARIRYQITLEQAAKLLFHFFSPHTYYPPLTYRKRKGVLPPAVTLKTRIGTPHIEPVLFRVTAAPATFNAEQIESDVWLPVATLIECQRIKRITSTELNGRKTSVKQLYNTQDWRVQFRCVMTMDDELLNGLSKNNDPLPYRGMQLVRQLFEVDKTIPVESRRLNDALGIHHLVIEQVSFPTVEGIQGYQPFTLACISDDPQAYKIFED